MNNEKARRNEKNPNQPTNQPNTYLKALKILTPAEIEVLDYVHQGYTNKEIASKLNLSPLTINTHKKNIRRKLKISGPKGLEKWLWKVHNGEN